MRLRCNCRERCTDAQELFLKRCFYTSGPYDAPTGYQDLDKSMTEQERATGKVRQLCPSTRRYCVYSLCH